MNPAGAPAERPEHPSVVRETRLLVRLLAGALVRSGCEQAEAEKRACLLLTPAARGVAVKPRGS